MVNCPSTKQDYVLLANAIREDPDEGHRGIMPLATVMTRNSRSDSYGQSRCATRDINRG